MVLENVQSCPICKSSILTSFLTTRDYTVSQSDFSINVCPQCNLGITTPRPALTSIPSFYQSDKYISHSGGQANPFDRLYRLARTLTLRWKYSLIRNLHANPSRLLDYGCGTGEFIQYVSSNNWKAIGVEPSELARDKAQQKKLSVYPGLEHIPGEFQVITLWHVLEHIHNLNEILDQLKSKLTASGTLLIAVPNYRSFDAQYYGSAWAGYDVPRHLWHFTKQNMEQLLKLHQLKLLNVIPMKLDAYYVSLLSEGYRASSANRLLLFCKALLLGLRSNVKAKSSGEYSSLLFVAAKE